MGHSLVKNCRELGALQNGCLFELPCLFCVFAVEGDIDPDRDRVHPRPANALEPVDFHVGDTIRQLHRESLSEKRVVGALDLDQRCVRLHRASNRNPTAQTAQQPLEFPPDRLDFGSPIE